MEKLTWVKINERLLEMERNPKDSAEFRKEWNSLLDMRKTIPGILVREKYPDEEQKSKEAGKETKRKRGKRKDVGDVQKNLG